MQYRILENRIWLLAYCTLIIKVILYLYIKLFATELSIVGGGNDADYYHRYALGYYDLIVNYWPVILRFLYDNGLYNRQIISLILFLTSFTLLPYLYYKMIKIKGQEIKLVKALSFFLIVFYPTLFYFTLDVYRDIVMFIVLLFSLMIYKKILDIDYYENVITRTKINYVFYFIIFLSLTYFLYLMRPYLGFALGITPFVYWILLKTKKYVKTWFIAYLLALILIKINGGFDDVLLYREKFFEYGQGGSTIGIRLYDTNIIMFLFYYMYSVLAQLFGLFFVNVNTILAFILEGIPFIFAVIYLFKNKRYINNFVGFLLVFFVIYSTIWLLGNDNMGTAVRLRTPSYLAIFASVFIVYQIKVLVSYEMIKEKMKKI